MSNEYDTILAYTCPEEGVLECQVSNGKVSHWFPYVSLSEEMKKNFDKKYPAMKKQYDDEVAKIAEQERLEKAAVKMWKEQKKKAEEEKQRKDEGKTFTVKKILGVTKRTVNRKRKVLIKVQWEGTDPLTGEAYPDGEVEYKHLSPALQDIYSETWFINGRRKKRRRRKKTKGKEKEKTNAPEEKTNGTEEDNDIVKLTPNPIRSIQHYRESNFVDLSKITPQKPASIDDMLAIIEREANAALQKATVIDLQASTPMAEMYKRVTDGVNKQAELKKALQTIKDVLAGSIVSRNASHVDGFHCDVCNVNLSSKQKLDKHKQSKKHIEKLQSNMFDKLQSNMFDSTVNL